MTSDVNISNFFFYYIYLSNSILDKSAYIIVIRNNRLLSLGHVNVEAYIINISRLPCDKYFHVKCFISSFTVSFS